MGELCRIPKPGYFLSQLIMKIGIAGYGNLGRSLEMAALGSEEIEVVGVFTRREPSSVKTIGTDAFPLSSIGSYKNLIDVLCICHGSSTDLPALAPKLAESFNTVDTYDNHKDSEGHKCRMDCASRKSGHISLVSLGWDPGFLSLMRLYTYSFFPSPSVNTFWGRGVSQGHSEALRKIDGVIKAIQYTVPKEDALTLAGLVSHPLSDTDRHRRVCYIVAEKGKEDLIASEVLSMENYFSGYQTELHFVSESEFDRYSASLSHRGRIYALGSSGRYKEVKHSLYLDLDIGSNPDFTAAIMLSGARAAYRLYCEKKSGAFSVIDVPPAYFSPFNCENVNKYL